MAGSQQDFPVLDDAGRSRGILSRSDLVTALQKGGASQRVSEIARGNGLTAAPAEPLEAAIQRMREKGQSSLPVVDGGRLVGLLTVENVSDLLLVRRALGQHARES
jgi:CBS domain-containing protein